MAKQQGTRFVGRKSGAARGTGEEGPIPLFHGLQNTRPLLWKSSYGSGAWSWANSDSFISPPRRCPAYMNGDPRWEGRLLHSGEDRSLGKDNLEWLRARLRRPPEALRGGL
ncbi:Protein of unknown function [Gryllus bimaculatus]|nr:Protein of unknown function [Gryllus bimaculatus]